MTPTHAAVAHPSNRLARRFRPWLLGLIAIDLGLLAVRLVRFPTYFANAGALTYAVEPVAALAIYAVVIGVVPLAAARVSGASAALRTGALVGLVCGAIELVDIAVESLWALGQHVVSIVTGIGMLSLFALFGVAGFLGRRRTRSFALGVAAAAWSAMLMCLVAVTFGFLLVNTSLPQLARSEVHDPDFLRSGWSDVTAFAIANTWDSGFTHLVQAPIFAAVLGAAGSGLAGIGRRRRLGAAP